MWHSYRQKPSTNTSTLSVSNAIGGAGSIVGDMASNSNIAIEEVNSNASGTDEWYHQAFTATGISICIIIHRNSMYIEKDIAKNKKEKSHYNLRLIHVYNWLRPAFVFQI